MKEKTQEKEQNNILDTFANSRLTIFLHSTGYTLVCLGLLAGGGYFIDEKLGTQPILFIAGLVISFPLSMFILYKKFKHYAQNHLNKIQ